ncbi:MAG: metallopeptidase family protein [Chloroflexi bacterium]|nr:metallopeptidase family protein [Chloroflexota bacterium]MCY3938886.1 metallopeptidase family protein [Chloroflexota bacterium]
MTSRINFETLVDQALDSIPDWLLERLENVAIVVEDAPDPEDLAEMDIPPGSELYGLYVGIPLTQRNSAYSMVLPDRIVIYRNALRRNFRDINELREQVRQTVLHEVGHALGMDHEKLAELGLI